MEESKRVEEMAMVAAADRASRESESPLDNLLLKINYHADKNRLVLSVLARMPDNYRIPAAPQLDELLIELLTPFAKDAEKIYELCKKFHTKYSKDLMLIIIMRGMSVRFLGVEVLSKHFDFPSSAAAFDYDSSQSFLGPFDTALHYDYSDEFIAFMGSIDPDLEMFYRGKQRKVSHIFVRNILDICSRDGSVVGLTPNNCRRLLEVGFRHMHKLEPNQEIELVAGFFLGCIKNKDYYGLIKDFGIAFNDYQKRVHKEHYPTKMHFGDILTNPIHTELRDTVRFFFLKDLRHLHSGKPVESEDDRIKLLMSIGYHLNAETLNELYGIRDIDTLVDTLFPEILTEMNLLTAHRLCVTNLEKMLSFWLTTRNAKINFMRRAFRPGGNAINSSSILVKDLDKKIFSRSIDEFLSEFGVKFKGLEILRILFPEDYLKDSLLEEIWPAGANNKAREHFGLERKVAKFLFDLHMLSYSSLWLNYGVHRLEIAMKLFHFLSNIENRRTGIIRCILFALEHHPRVYEFGMAIGSQPKLVDFLTIDEECKKAFKSFCSKASDNMDGDCDKNEKRMAVLKSLLEKSGSYKPHVRIARLRFLYRLSDFTGYPLGFFTHKNGVPVPQLDEPVSLESTRGKEIVRFMQEKVDTFRVRGGYIRSQALLPEFSRALEFRLPER